MRSLSLFILVSLLLFVGISPVLACSPMPTAVNNPPPHIPTLEEYVQTSPIIFTGRVSRELAFGGWGRFYEIEVENYLKGSGFAIVEIRGFGYGSDCLPTIQIWIYAGGFILVLLPIGGILLWKWRFNPRKSKAKRGE